MAARSVVAILTTRSPSTGSDLRIRQCPWTERYDGNCWPASSSALERQLHLLPIHNRCGRWTAVGLAVAAAVHHLSELGHVA